MCDSVCLLYLLYLLRQTSVVCLSLLAVLTIHTVCRAAPLLTPPLPIHLPLPLPLALVQQPVVLGREVVQVAHAAPREDHVAHLG